MAEPFTIKIFVPDGDPESVRIISHMNWTGCGIAFPRDKWQDIKGRPELGTPGVYILSGHASDETLLSKDEDLLPTIYVGQGDSVNTRIDSHYQSKDFWDWGVAFVSTGSDSLNRAHITWLEYALIDRAVSAKRCCLDNGNTPREPNLDQGAKADTQKFLKEILQILPLVGLRVFEEPKKMSVSDNTETSKLALVSDSGGNDTIIVPAKKEGFQEVFIGEDCWYAIRISGGMLHKIKYIAAYQSAPVSAITHVAPVSHIEPYGDGTKYKVVFAEPAKEIPHIGFADAPSGSAQGTRYTTYDKLKSAKKISELF